MLFCSGVTFLDMLQNIHWGLWILSENLKILHTKYKDNTGQLSTQLGDLQRWSLGSSWEYFERAQKCNNRAKGALLCILWVWFWMCLCTLGHNCWKTMHWKISKWCTLSKCGTLSIEMSRSTQATFQSREITFWLTLVLIQGEKKPLALLWLMII